MYPMNYEKMKSCFVKLCSYAFSVDAKDQTFLKQGFKCIQAHYNILYIYCLWWSRDTKYKLCSGNRTICNPIICPDYFPFPPGRAYPMLCLVHWLDQSWVLGITGSVRAANYDLALHWQHQPRFLYFLEAWHLSKSNEQTQLRGFLKQRQFWDSCHGEAAIFSCMIKPAVSHAF